MTELEILKFARKGIEAEILKLNKKEERGESLRRTYQNDFNISVEKYENVIRSLQHIRKERRELFDKEQEVKRMIANLQLDEGIIDL